MWKNSPADTQTVQSLLRNFVQQQGQASGAATPPLGVTEVFVFYYLGKMLYCHCLRLDNGVPNLLPTVLQALHFVVVQLRSSGLHTDDMYRWCEGALAAIEKMVDAPQLAGLKGQFNLLKTRILVNHLGTQIAPVAPTAKPLPAFPQILKAIDDYHQQLKQDGPWEEIVADLFELEARFLYDRCGPFLLQALATPNCPGREKALERALSLCALLANAGLCQLTFFWYYQLHELDALTDQSEVLLAAYLKLHLSLQQAAPIKTVPCFQQNQQTLKQHRQTLEKDLFMRPSEALKAFNQSMRQFAIHLCEEAAAWLGGPSILTAPSDNTEAVRVCLISLGSMSRRTMTAYSDMEYAILLPLPSDAEWEEASHTGTPPRQRAWRIRAFAEVLEFLVRSLGETGEGFCLDDSSQPRLEFHLRSTPAHVIGRCTGIEINDKDGLVYSLLHADYLCGDVTLFKQFEQERDKLLASPCSRKKAKEARGDLWQDAPLPWHCYWAIAQFKRNSEEHEKYFITGSETPGLKKPYSKLLSFMLLDLALYFNLPAKDLETAARGLQTQAFVLPKETLEEIVAAISWLLQARCEVELQEGRQFDQPLPKHQAKLKEIYQRLLAPYYSALPALIEEGAACFTQAFWQARLPIFFTAEVGSCRVRVLAPGQVEQLYYLPAALAKKMFTAKGVISPTGETRNSAVFNLDGQVCLKILLPDDPQPGTQVEALTVFCAREHAVNSLGRLLGFQVTAPGCAVELRYQLREKQAIVYYAWAAQHVPGRDALNAAQDNPETLKQLLKQDYSALFLLSLLVYSDDQQPRNFIVQPIEGTAFYRLISIDNKRSFVTPFTPVTGLFKLLGKAGALNIKTFLYLLPYLGQTFDANMAQQCAALDLQTLPCHWSKALTALDNALSKVLPKPVISSPYQFNYLQIEKYLAYGLPLRLTQVLQELQKDTSLAHQGLLEKFEPEVARCYRNLLTSPLGARDFYRVFQADYRLDSHGRGYSDRTLQFIRDNEVRAKQIGESLRQASPDFFETIQWGKLPLDEQHGLLKLMENQNFSTLNLAGCQALNETILGGLLRSSPKLKVLDISNCIAISGEVFRWLAKHNRHIQAIYCSDNPNLQAVTVDSALQQLETLSLQNCKNLQKVNGSQTAKLRYVSVSRSLKAQVVNATGYAIAFHNRGIAKNNLGRYLEAIADYDEAIRLKPDDANAFHNRGVAKNNLGCYIEAIADCDEAIRLKPDDANTFNNRGFAKNGLGRYIEAIADYDEAIRLKPDDANTFNNRGFAKNGLGRYIEAIADYDEAIRLKPDDANAFHNRGIAKRRLGRYQEAIADYDEAIRLKPDDANTFNNRGFAKKNLGRYIEAIADYDEAIRLKPDDANAFHNRGIAKKNLGRYIEAIADYDEAIRLKPDDANAFHNRGIAKKNLGRYLEAIADYDEAIRLKPDYTLAFDNREIAKKNVKGYQDTNLQNSAISSITPTPVTSPNEIVPEALPEKPPAKAPSFSSQALSAFEKQVSNDKQNQSAQDRKCLTETPNGALTCLLKPPSNLETGAIIDDGGYFQESPAKLQNSLLGIQRDPRLQDTTDKQATGHVKQFGIFYHKHNLASLNANGDDRTLATHGEDPHYWYSLVDSKCLLLSIRQEKLNYHKLDGGTYSCKTGEEHEFYRENQQRIFVPDAYVLKNFSSSFSNDIKTITGCHIVDEHGIDHRAKNNSWSKMPVLLILSILHEDERHWCCMRVQIDYDKAEATILWDDPFGATSFGQGPKNMILKGLQENLAFLLQQENHDSKFKIIYQHDKTIIQQEQGNGWDCGPIVHSNIKDYTDLGISNAQFASIGASAFYALPAANDNKHAQTMQQTRKKDREVFIKVSSTQADETSGLKNKMS